MDRVKVTDTDMGWNKIKKETAIFQGSSVLIGFQEGSVTKEQVKGQREKKGNQSMPEIAAQNEFGTKIIPARPFMRTSFDENIGKIQKIITIQYGKVLDGKQDAELALLGVGLFVSGLIKLKIRSIQSPPLSRRTIEAKGSSKPLIDFGQMIQSVREKVVLG